MKSKSNLIEPENIPNSAVSPDDIIFKGYWLFIFIYNFVTI